MKTQNLRWPAWLALCLTLWCGAENAASAELVPLFDGRTLNGWIKKV